MNKIPSYFSSLPIDAKRLEELDALPEPRGRYILAMTPRSGSSYLCDVMTDTKRFGSPDEFLNEDFIPDIMKKIPGRTPEEYLRNVFRVRRTANGISGLKASWFQFRNFIECVEDRASLGGLRFVYLIRRDLAAQAISLYKATATSVFHTNVEHGNAAIERLRRLDYDYQAISSWYDHLLEQEAGWKAFFFECKIFPLTVTYEDIQEDVLGTMRRIAQYVGVEPKNVQVPTLPSVFRPVSDERNLEWACRFRLERAASMAAK